MIIASRKDEVVTQTLNELVAANKRIAELEAENAELRGKTREQKAQEQLALWKKEVRDKGFEIDTE